MSIYELKPAFQNLLRPGVRRIFNLGITPNQVTLFTCAISVVVAAIVYFCSVNLFYLLPVFFFFRMALNAIDGMLAKEFNMKTPLGAVLNEVTDVFSDGILYYVFIKFNFIHSVLLLFIIFLSALSELTGLAALLNGKPRQYQGPMGKSDRAFAFGVMAILVSINFTNEKFYFYFLLVILLLLIRTILNRIKNSI